MKNNNTDFISRISSNWYRNLALIQNGFMKFSQDFYNSNNYTIMNFPITTSSISSPMGLGSDSLPVEISLYNVKTYLADSMQFMLEYGCRIVNGPCYYIMPSFRGERCDRRHLNQFFHSEAEIIGNLEDVQKVVEDYLYYLNENFLEKYADEIIKMGNTVEHIEKVQNNHKIERVSYLEMVNFINRHNLSFEMLEYLPNCKHPVINSKGEKYILDNFNNAVWLMYFPDELVPFYQDSNNSIAQNADLLLGYGEVVGCGQRHCNADNVIKSLNMHNVEATPYDWYIKMKRHFPIQTSGFGMGMERYLLWLLSCDDIRKLQMLNRENGKIIIP